MATNENVNKVIYGNQTVMDITDTTAEESDVASGEVFYKANGARSVGTLNKDSAVWGNITGTLSDQTDLQTELNRAYSKTASETSSLDDLDLIPVQKISASSDGRRNIKFRNLKSVLKTYFDSIYSTFSGSYNDLTNKPTAGTGIAINNNIIAVDADNTPTENSEKPVKSKGVYEVVEQIYADNGVLGAKNRIIFPYTYDSRTVYGVTFTVNADGSITISGVNDGTAESRFYLIQRASYLSKGDYIVSKGDNSDSRINISVDGFSNVGSYVKTLTYGTKDDRSVTIDYNGYVEVGSSLVIPKNADFTTPITIYPMLRLASDPDDTYVPYAMTNRELTEEMTVKESAVTDIVEGATVGSDYGNHLIKKGNIVQLSLRLTEVTVQQWKTVICRIPEGYRPKYRTAFRDVTAGKYLYCMPSGIIQSGATNFSNTELLISATWITD